MSDNSSRRNFLKTSSTAAVGAGLLANLPMQAGAFAAGDDTLKIGLVGCGGRGRGAAEQSLLTNGKVKMIALGDAFPEPIEALHRQLKKKFSDRPERVDIPEENKFVGFDAYQKVIDSGVDIVMFATPPGFRPLHFSSAIKAGKHVFMEKPVATDPQGIRKVLAAVEESKKKDLKVGVGLQRHHQSSYLAALEQLRNGAIGDIVTTRVYWNSGGVWDPRVNREQAKSEMEYQLKNWYYYTWLCGDHICEQHIHNLDVGNWWRGSFPVKARGMGGREVRTAKKYGQIFDHFACQFEYEDGGMMISECRHIPSCWNSVSEVATGTKGTLSTKRDRRKPPMRIEQRGKMTWYYDGENPNPYEVEHQTLQTAIREGKEYNEGHYGAMSTMTAILGRMATYSGSEITMDEALKKGRTIFPYGGDLTFETTPPVTPDEDGWYPIPTPGVTEVLTG